MVVALARVVARAVVAGRALAGDALVSVRLPAVARCAHVPQLYQRVVAEAGHPVPERAAVLVVVLPFLRVAALLAGFRVVPRRRGHGRRRRRERRRIVCSERRGRVVRGFRVRDPQEQEDVSWCHAGQSVLATQPACCHGCQQSECPVVRGCFSPVGLATRRRRCCHRSRRSISGLGQRIRSNNERWAALRSAPPCGVFSGSDWSRSNRQRVNAT